MTQSDQAVISIFSIQKIIGPMAMEASFCGPKCVDKIQATLVDVAGKASFQTSQCVQRGGGREEVGHGRTGDCQKAAMRRGLREEPVAHCWINREAEMCDEGDRSSRGVEIPQLLVGPIAPGVIVCLQSLQTADQPEGIGRIYGQILVSAQGNERIVSGPKTCGLIRIISAIRPAKSLKLVKESCGAFLCGIADCSPATCQGPKMNQVEAGTVAK